MSYFITAEICSSCGLCADLCPAEAISPIGVYRIDNSKCNNCGQCEINCPQKAIQKK